MRRFDPHFQHSGRAARAVSPAAPSRRAAAPEAAAWAAPRRERRAGGSGGGGGGGGRCGVRHLGAAASKCMYGASGLEEARQGRAGTAHRLAPGTRLVVSSGTRRRLATHVTAAIAISESDIGYRHRDIRVASSSMRHSPGTRGPALNLPCPTSAPAPSPGRSEPRATVPRDGVATVHPAVPRARQASPPATSALAVSARAPARALPNFDQLVV